MADEELIKQFVELQNKTERLISEKKPKEAKQKYLELVELYHTIEKSKLEHYHKELAYDQINSLFKKVNECKETRRIPYHLVLAGLLIIGLSLVIFLKPSIVGLAGLEDVIRQPVNITFTETKLQQIALKDKPIALMASGTYTGNVKLFYKEGEKFELIYESSGQNGTFKDACTETCEMSAPSNFIELFAQIEAGGKLQITELAYKVRREGNTAPVWKATTKNFIAQNGKTLTLDMNDYFEDADNDPLVYLSTAAEGIDVKVQNSKVTLTPKSAGSKKIVLIASDLRQITRVPVTVDVS